MDSEQQSPDPQPSPLWSPSHPEHTLPQKSSEWHIGQPRTLPSQQVEPRRDSSKHQFSSIRLTNSWGTHRTPGPGLVSPGLPDRKSLHTEAASKVQPLLYLELVFWVPGGRLGGHQQHTEGLTNPAAIHSPATLEHLPCAQPCPWDWGFSSEQNTILTQGLCWTLRRVGSGWGWGWCRGNCADLGQASWRHHFVGWVLMDEYTVARSREWSTAYAMFVLKKNNVHTGFRPCAGSFILTTSPWGW